MWVGIRELGRLAGLRWEGLAAGGGAFGALWLLGFRMDQRGGQRRREKKREEELEAYARFEVRLSGGGMRPTWLGG